MILTFIEHAENFRWAQNVRNLQLNIFILDLNPFLKWSLRPNNFYKLTKTYFVKKSMLPIENQILFSQKVLKHD